MAQGGSDIRRLLNRTRWIAKRVPTAEGRDRLRRAWFWKEASRYTEAIVSRDRQGNRVVLKTSDPWVCRDTFLDGAHDRENIDNLIRALHDRGIVPAQIIDVGAHVGTSTLELLSAYPRATAISIEPDPDNYRLLRQNIIANGLEDRAQTVNVAVGDTHGTVDLTVSDTNSGDHRVASPAPGPKINVPIRRLDELAQPDKTTLLWVDVQGYEGHVFRGAPNFLACPAFVEFWPFRLQEVDGYTAFAEAVDCYSIVLDARDSLRPVHDLNQLATRILSSSEYIDGYTDLLLLP